MLDFEWSEVSEEETDMHFTMARTLTDPQAVGREFHLGLHGVCGPAELQKFERQRR